MARRVADRCGVCGAQIHSKATVTWVDDGVIHVICYKPGLGKKARKPAMPGTLGLRDGRTFVDPGVSDVAPATPLESRATGS